MSGPVMIHTTRLLVNSVHAWMTQLSLTYLLLYLHHILQIPMTSTTMNVLSHHNRNPLLLFTTMRYHNIISSPVPDSHLSNIFRVSIRMKPKQIYIPTPMFLVIIFTFRKTGEGGYTTQDTKYSICNIPFRKSQNRFLE